MEDPLCCVSVLGGIPQGAGTACTAPEACCLPGGGCVTADPLCCTNVLGGMPQGAGSACSVPEACCLPDGSCIMEDPLCCAFIFGGVPQGTGSNCTATVACCFPDGTCQTVSRVCCDDIGGTPSPTGAATCLGDADLNGTDDACEGCDWNYGDPHKMHYPQLPDEAGWDVNATYPIVLADDWMCTETGMVKDFHFWGSWKHGIEGTIQFFILSIHSDIPADPPQIPYSRPGPILWEFETDQFGATPIDPPSMEGWYDPETGEVIPNDHQAYFQYNICLDSIFWFPQDSGTIYWLNITAVVLEAPMYQWGWKSTQNHWNDDAVWSNFGEYDWIEMYEPGGSSTGPITNAFGVTVDETGNFAEGWGENAYDDQWFYYPWYDWWNVWFYDHPYDPTRYKEITVDFDVFMMNPTAPAYFEIAVNWSTDAWSLDQPPADSNPPLPGTDEDLYIGRATLMADEYFEGHYTYTYVIPNYNPEWVSIDVRGYNFYIPGGIIEHECIGQQSLDLSFVITGGEDCDCIPGDANGDGSVNVGDAVYIIAYVFKGGPAPTPYQTCSGDANCDCTVNVGDAVYIINYVFKQGPPPCDCLTWLSLCGPPLRK
jgi:hypothetical protein